MKNVINKHKSNKIKENSNTVRHLNNGTDHRHSKSCCDQSSPARRTISVSNAEYGIGARSLVSNELGNWQERREQEIIIVPFRPTRVGVLIIDMKLSHFYRRTPL